MTWLMFLQDHSGCCVDDGQLDRKGRDRETSRLSRLSQQKKKTGFHRGGEKL